MCIILACKSSIPTLGSLRRSEKDNPDGGGVAWIQNGQVRWRKGLTADAIASVIATIDLPFIVHFRLATIGNGNKLTHPFPISKSASLKLEGQARAVLFHNGHWSDWAEYCRETLLRHKAKVPGGSWSDSRAMAWLASVYDMNFLSFLSNQRIAVLHRKKGIVLFGDGWTESNGISYSNTSLIQPKSILYKGNYRWQQNDITSYE